ncbi:thiamine pyrophosphate-dependent enzyme [Streptomyces sp. DG2A-72]|uniref:thiamine pyrophosphate-dependent enzyme n=1 Tax=Streptomyces sp. DG2A-72 TaxID=3051386 RepID=UPI00265C7198|nr:thiamine pyrophosphate-dependent enzyme [Streptomyces sp. DG2A-72]MDO0933571.1 thiamine pyrophosphate-dependent enzyme [Streptomyces sp. DG2A-72]
MNKHDVISAVIATTTDEPIVFTTGFACRIAQSIADRPGHFYMTGSMGLAADIGIGVALSSDRRAVVVDGDGSLAMNPGCLLTAGSLPDLRLLHVVLDDQIYESTGGQQAPSTHVDFCELARAAGYSSAHHVGDLPTLRRELPRHLRCDGPTLVHCSIVATGAPNPGPRIALGLPQIAARFAEHLQAAVD